MRTSALLASLVTTLATAAALAATNVPIAAKKLVVIDQRAVAGKARVSFVAADKTAGITNGTDPTVEVSGRFGMVYAGGSPAGAFTMNGWIVNKPAVSKFVNKTAPAGRSHVKVAKIVPDKLIRVLAKDLGNPTFDILSAGAPAGSVFTGFCVANAGVEICHCSEFTSCFYKSVAGGNGAKLVCKSGVGDPTCTAAFPLGIGCCEHPLLGCMADAEVHHGDSEQLCRSVAGATVGSVGSVCGGAGACVPPPGTPGQCCQTDGDSCWTGAGFTQTDCENGGGVYFPSAVCGAGGQCL